MKKNILLLLALFVGASHAAPKVNRQYVDSKSESEDDDLLSITTQESDDHSELIIIEEIKKATKELIIKIKETTYLYNYWNEELEKLPNKEVPKKEFESINMTLESLDDDLKESIDEMKKSFNSLLD